MVGRDELFRRLSRPGRGGRKCVPSQASWRFLGCLAWWADLSGDWGVKVQM